MTEDAIASFIAARKNRPQWGGVPQSHRPASVADAYKLQKAVYERLESQGVKRAGYKVGSITKDGQRAAGLTEPLYAGIFEINCKPTLAEALPDNLIDPSIECEIAFVLRSDLDARRGALSPQQVVDAVGTCHLACEVIDNRYGDPKALGLPAILVDDAFHSAFVLAPADRRWPNIRLSNLKAEIVTDETTARANIDDALLPLQSLQWLAEKLAQVDNYLKAGEVIMSGSSVVPTKIKIPAKSLRLSIEGFGELKLER